MKTKQIYYQDPYLKELDCQVISVEDKGNLSNVILDQTIFYPEGGGQPSDRGMLGEAKVEYVRMQDGEIIHQIKGSLEEGQQIHAILDWDYRYKYMKIHTAGHLIHDVLMTMTDNLQPIRGGHGKKPFIEYQGELAVAIQQKLEGEVNKTAKQGLIVITKEASYDEIVKNCQFIPPNLPKNKPLRMIKIGDFPGMPDGGVQVKNTNEIGKIWLANIAVVDGVTTIRYGVAGND